MSVLIDKEALFKERMRTGINLFTGSGFSILPFNGLSLPTGDDLCKEVCTKFGISKIYGNDLETISTLAPKESYQSYLRKKFTVDGCNSLYNCINSIKLKSFITTNIDNIAHHIVSNKNKYFLKSIAYYGASKSTNAKLDFIPLHGDVTDINSLLYFGKFDLAVVDDINSELFSEMHVKLLDSPTLFWGYGFHDSGVLKSISKVLRKKAQDFWVQCRPGNEKMIELFRNIGCNVIIADTENLLTWIQGNTPKDDEHHSGDVMARDLNVYSIPTISDPRVESLPASEYYVKGFTHWYPVLVKQAFESSMVNKAYDAALNHKNLIIVGGNFAGKSTLLMQLALKVDSNNKLFIRDAISKEEAAFIVSKINDATAWIFFEKATLDIESFRILSKATNIKVVSISDDYSFESSKHLLAGISYGRLEVGEIERREAELIFEHVPASLRRENFRFKDSENDKYSMLELISKNIYGVFTRERITQILLSIKKENKTAIETIALASYLASNNSALSTDIVFSFFKLKDYSEVQNTIDLASSTLNNYAVDMHTDFMDQDYYILRSKLFSRYADEAFSKNIELKQIYADVIHDFVYNVSTLKIFNYHIFRRSAYDGNLFANLFGENGNDIYNFLYEKFKNPYTLQQWALFLGRIGKHEEAFAYINRARGELPNNFSIKNSEAILQFEANKRKKTDLAISKMSDAMIILENCYKNDKRKVYHAQKYAEFALFFYREYQKDTYIAKAKTWLAEIIDQKDSLSPRTCSLQRELNFIGSK